MCNKILRYAPGPHGRVHKLGITGAKKGFTSDAKQNFLEYADRMQRIGKMDEAFRALKEFADLCPGQDDVRLMLAEQLTRANKKEEALEQLEILYDTLLEQGRSTESVATLERMNALDPAFKPRRTATPRKRQKGGLVSWISTRRCCASEAKRCGHDELWRTRRCWGVPEIAIPEGFVTTSARRR